MSRTLKFTFVVLAIVLFRLASPSVGQELMIGDPAPDFPVRTLYDSEIRLSRLKGENGLVIAFVSYKCPVVHRYEGRFNEFARDYEPRGVNFVAVNIHADKDIEAMKQRSERYDFAYVYDPRGKMARTYGAAVTPHMFILNENGRLAYTGAFDDNMVKPNREYVKDAVRALLDGKEPCIPVTKPFGCPIKAEK